MNRERAIAGYRQDGAAVLSGVVGGEFLSRLAAEFERLARVDAEASGASAVYGIRGLLKKSLLVARSAASGPLHELATDIIGQSARPVRAIFFDKSPGANWPLPWHQDRVAALRTSSPPPEFRKWTVKDGVPHAELSLDYLRAMVTLRLHLDSCDAATGALWVLPGHHSGPVLSDSKLRAAVANGAPTVLSVAAGSVVIMSPLTPHCSHRATRPARRRVLHIEYCSKDLPSGVDWAEAV